MASKRKTKARAKPRAAVKRRQAAKASTGSQAADQSEQEFLLHRRIDDLAAAYVSALAEMWIIKDRQAVLEQVLAQNGIAVSQAVEQFEPSGEFKARLDDERREWTRRMVGALFRKGLPTVK